MLTAKMRAAGGSVRSSLGMNSAMTTVPLGRKRVEHAFEELAAIGFAFAVQNVAKRRELEAIAIFCRLNVSFDVRELIAQFVLAHDFSRDGNHAGPIDSGYLDVRRALGHRDSPHAGAGGDVEHFEGLGHFFQQGLGGNFGCRIAAVVDFLDEISKGIGCRFFLGSRPMRVCRS